MRVLIVDDEAPARTRLRLLLGDMQEVVLVGEAANGRAALELIPRVQPNVVLLDIRMPLMDGLETAEHLAKFPAPPTLIFTTAYEQYALSAFKLHAVDYLLKPASREKLRLALEKARIVQHGKLQLLRQDLGGQQQRTHVSATHAGGIRLAPVSEVRFFKAEQKYVRVYWPGETLLLEESLRLLEKEFGELFLRVHRNALVAKRHIQSLEREPGKGLILRLHDIPEKLEISRRLLPQVRKLLRSRNPA